MSNFKKLLHIFYGEIWFVVNACLVLWFNTKPPRMLLYINLSFPKLFVVLSAVLFVATIIISIVKKKFGIYELCTLVALISASALWIRFNIISSHYRYGYPAVDLIFAIPLMIFAIVLLIKIINLIITHIKNNSARN